MDLSNASLQQQQLLPSGCQIWNRHVLAASPSGKLIAYASTVGIAIFDISASPVALKMILGHHDSSEKRLDNIVCIMWHPSDEDVLVSASQVDLMTWSLSATRPCQSTIALPKPFVNAAWCIHNTTIIAVACHNSRVYEWKIGTAIFKECFTRPTKVRI